MVLRMNDDDFNFNDPALIAEFNAMVAAEAFEDAVAGRQKYGISMERTCAWLVMIIEGLNEAGKFPLDQSPEEVGSNVSAWLIEQGVPDNQELTFEGRFVGPLINPESRSEHIQTSCAEIVLTCSSYGPCKGVSAELVDGVISILNEKEDPFGVYLEAAFGADKPNLH